MWQIALQVNCALHKELSPQFFMSKSTDIFAYLQTQTSLGIKLATAFSKCMHRSTWVLLFTEAGIMCVSSGINGSGLVPGFNSGYWWFTPCRTCVFGVYTHIYIHTHTHIQKNLFAPLYARFCVILKCFKSTWFETSYLLYFLLTLEVSWFCLGFLAYVL